MQQAILKRNVHHTGSFQVGETVNIITYFPSGCYYIESLDGVKSAYVGEFEVSLLDDNDTNNIINHPENNEECNHEQ